MCRFSLTIGDKTFLSKKDALKFYKQILDAYDFGEKLSEYDARYLIMLAYKDHILPNELAEFADYCVSNFNTNDYKLNKTKHLITGIIVDRHPEFKSTKCFYFINLLKNETSKDIFSYRQAINGLPTDIQIFSRACRFCVHNQLRKFKIQQFKNRPVRCAISNDVVEWEECQVDHKAPLTFSVIVKSFIVSYRIDVETVEYSYHNSREVFVNLEIAEKFYEFHRNMAVLRILSAKENNKRSGKARVQPTKKDTILED